MKTYTQMPGIRRRRRELRIEVGTAADALGVTRQTWSNWEAGRAMPAAGVLPAMAELLDCKIQDLYEEEGDDDGTPDE